MHRGHSCATRNATRRRHRHAACRCDNRRARRIADVTGCRRFAYSSTRQVGCVRYAGITAQRYRTFIRSHIGFIYYASFGRYFAYARLAAQYATVLNAGLAFQRYTTFIGSNVATVRQLSGRAKQYVLANGYVHRTRQITLVVLHRQRIRYVHRPLKYHRIVRRGVISNVIKIMYRHRCRLASIRKGDRPSHAAAVAQRDVPAVRILHHQVLKLIVNRCGRFSATH